MSKTKKKKTVVTGPRQDWRKAPQAELENLSEEELGSLFGTIKAPLELGRRPGTLTIAMIVKNESANIRDAIKSFRPIADEIVVFDTGSTDGTQQILTQLGVRWQQGEWRNDFAWARNQSIELAASAWVLWMDADDRIPENQYENFRKLKTAPLDRAFGFQVINTQGGLPYGARFMQLRMFPNHPDLRFRYRIHEQLLHSVALLGLHTFFTDTTILHTGYEDPQLKKAKAKRNLLLLEKETDRVRKEPSLGMSVGDSYYILGEWEKGIQAYQDTLAMPNCEKINRDIYRELPCCIGRGYHKSGRRAEALDWYDRSIALQPAKHEPYFYKAECLLELNRAAEAEALYIQLTAMPVSHSTTTNQFDIIQIYSHYHLARFAHERGDISGAAARLETLNEKYPEVIEAWHLLGRCQLALGQEQQALESWTRALALNPRAIPELHGQRMVLLRKLGRKEEFEASENQARALYPQASLPVWNSRPALSLCMIVKNEKSNLPACLDSTQGLADEIIVVDTGSQDGTQDIARERGARVVQANWEGDFSKARNLSLAEATGRWILWLDADDRMLPEDKAAIRKLAEADPDAVPRGYGMLVKNTRDGGKTGSVFNQVRMFPNRPNIRFRAPVHEQVLPALEEAGIGVEYTAIRVLHTGYSDPETARAKQVRNKAILDAQVASGQGITPVTLFTLANACADLGLHAEAAAWYIKAGASARAAGNNPHVAAAAASKAAAAMASQGLHRDALELLEPELSSGKPGPEAVLVKAQVEAAMGKPEAARPWFEKLLGFRESGTFIPVDFQMLKIQGLQFLGKYWFDRGNRDLAVTLLKAGLGVKEGVEFGPDELDSLYRRFKAA